MGICIVRINLGKLALRQKVNVVARIFDRFEGYVCLEISRCCSESISMKVSDVITYIMKIM